MTGKRAIQRLVVGDDGRLRTILIDLMTLEPVVDPTGYYVVNQGETEPEPVPDVDDPAVVTEEPATVGETSRGERDSRNDVSDPRSSFPSAPAPSPQERSVGTSIARKAIADAVSSPVGNATLRAQEQNTPTPTARPDPVGIAGGAVNKPSTPGIDYSQIGGNRPNKVAAEHEGFLSNIARDAFGKDAKVSVTSGDVDPHQPGWTAEDGKYSKSHRHTDELGADVQFTDPVTGQKVTDKNVMGDIGMAAAARNKTAGIGYGTSYMGDDTIHIDQANKGGLWNGVGGTAFAQTQSEKDKYGNIQENIADARALGIGPTQRYGAPTPTAKPSDTTSSFASQDERVQDRTVAGDVIAEAKDVSKEREAVAPMMGFAGGAVNRPSTPGLKVDTERTKTGTTVTDDGYTSTERTGSRGWRNNNPGNIRAGPFAEKVGAIGRDAVNANGTFAVFGSYEEGRKAQADLLNTERYQKLSINDAIARYAPPKENDTKRYQKEITSALGISGTTKMSDLTPSQRETMVDAMAKVEGSTRPGKETKSQHTYSGPPGTRDRDAPSEKSGGRFGGSGLGYSGKGGSDSPSERSGGRFGGSGLGSGYSSKGGRDSPSEGGGRFGGKGLGSSVKSDKSSYGGGPVDKAEKGWGGGSKSSSSKSSSKSSKSSGGLGKSKDGSDHGWGGRSGSV